VFVVAWVGLVGGLCSSVATSRRVAYVFRPGLADTWLFLNGDGRSRSISGVEGQLGLFRLLGA